MSNDTVTKADILYLKQQLNRIENTVDEIKKIVRTIQANQ
jgi:hypothetical protein